MEVSKTTLEHILDYLEHYERIYYDACPRCLVKWGHKADCQLWIDIKAIDKVVKGDN